MGTVCWKVSPIFLPGGLFHRLRILLELSFRVTVDPQLSLRGISGGFFEGLTEWALIGR